ncbi:MAG: tRNA lysidine(34) synthetase TilS [Ignavibacteriaceae bacterium]
MKKIEQKVIKFIDENELLVKGDRVLVALSGGPDSVFLLYLFHKYKKKFDISISAFHLNHQIRGKEADKDEKFCRKMCADLSISFFPSSWDVKKIAREKKISIEEAGRSVRYAELKRISDQEGFTKIATAHNSGDNAETVLLNLIKGAGLRGAAGIPVIRDNIIRPIMILSKEEILKYLKQNKINFRLDRSNLSNDYERNYIRNKIIPLIKKRLNPSFENTILSSSFIFRNLLKESDKKLAGELESYYNVQDGTVKVNVDKIAGINDSERTEILKLLIERNFYNPITFKDIIKILSLIKKETGTKVNLSGNLTGARERTEIFIYKNTVPDNFEHVKIKAGEKIKLNGHTFFINNDVKIPEKFPNNRLVEYISADNIKEDFILRCWEEGDRFNPLGLKGSKKISDFLNDQKVTSTDKKKQLVLTNDGRIVWVIGLRIDERFKIKKSTKKVYQICLI